MQIRVTHTIDDLSNDLAAIPVDFAKQAPRVVKRSAHEGSMVARRLARGAAGPHGKDYYKRITDEMTGPYSAEYGPEGIPKSNFIGAGWRHGVNMDLPNSADLIGPKFADAIGDLIDSVFWS